ncbi:MAG: hypothetical protein WC334_07055 [Kiritimatiellales bacterium]
MKQFSYHFVLVVVGLVFFIPSAEAYPSGTILINEDFWYNGVYYATSPAVFGDTDQDLVRDGFQIKYSWAVCNNTGSFEPDDNLWKFTLEANLDSRGCYACINSGSDWSTYPDSVTDSFFWLADRAGNYPVFPSATKYFLAFIDLDMVIGNELVLCYGTSNNGQSLKTNATAPITRVQTTTNGVSFGWLYDHHLVPTNSFGEVTNSADFEIAANLDANGNGLANWQEYIVDIDPNSSGSTFRVTVSESGLSWHSATGRVYTVKGATSLTDAFTFVTNFPGITGTLSYTTAGTDGFRFYRIQVELAP